MPNYISVFSVTRGVNLLGFANMVVAYKFVSLQPIETLTKGLHQARCTVIYL